MSAQVIVLLVIVVIAILLFLSERLRPDLIALLVMLSLGLTGILTTRDMFSGLSNPSTILVMTVLIMTGGLFRTGVSAAIGRWLVRAAGNREGRLLTLVVSATAGLSLFMNNIAAAAVIMPAIIDATHRTKIRPSKLLLPMAMSTQLMGMATLFTTANIVTSGVLVSLGLPGFGVFDFLTVGGTAGLASLAFLILFSRRLLPERTPVETAPASAEARQPLSEIYRLDERLQAVQLKPSSVLVWKSVAETGLRQHLGASVLGIQRHGKTMVAPAPSEQLQPADVLLLEARPLPSPQLETFGLTVVPAEDWVDLLAANDFALTEILVAPRSRFVGRSLKDIQFRSRYNVAVVGLLQGDQVYRAAAADVRLRGGEAVLVLGAKDRLSALRTEPDWIVLRIDEDQAAHTGKMWLAVAIMLAALVVSAVSPWPVAFVFLIGALGMILSGCLTADEAYQAVDWRSVFLVGGMLPLGVALTQTGAARLLGNGIISLTGPYGPLATVGGLFLLSMVLNQFIPGGSAVPAVLVPIAIAAAQGLGADPRAFALAVAVSTGTSHLTPFAHPVNVLVMGPGGYTSRDYLVLGLPLVVITFVITLLTLHWFWGV
jgi:di/tricarboxylate transporter